MNCKYIHHSMYMERHMLCPGCGTNKARRAERRVELSNKANVARLATAGMPRALGDFVRHLFAWVHAQVNR